MDDREVRMVLLPVTLAGFFFRAFGYATLQMEQVASETLRRALRDGIDPVFTLSPQSLEIPQAQGLQDRNIETPFAQAQNIQVEDCQIQDSLVQNPRAQPFSFSDTTDTQTAESQPPTKEKTMADTNLNDDMVKLVQYAIVSIKRREERILKGKGSSQSAAMLYLETDNITGDGFSNARIADWVRDHCEEAKDVDLDSLRVYYDVVGRWPRSSLKYEEERLDLEDEKLKLLQEIAKGK